jgi:uncharacterized protein YecE (DUF72 family)
MPRLHIGTSGWSYAHWSGVFYPPDLRAQDRLVSYAGRLHSAEINAAFYRMPTEQAVAHWRDSVDAGFVFAVKASRFITHAKKLKDPADTVPGFIERMDGLGGRLGPILFQLPPRWRRDRERLAGFLAALDRRHRYAFELRDPDWHDDEILALLDGHDCAFCIYELDGFLSPLEITADFVYVRLHGPDGAYRGSYGDAALASWAGRIRCWQAQGLDVYCYFDNDEAGYAPRNAMTLQRMLQG